MLLFFFEMLINISDYNITQNDVPVLTRADDGTYIQTNCLLNNFNIYSGDLTNILTGFDYKNNILDLIRQYGHSQVYTLALRILTNYNIQTPDFCASQDILAVAIFMDWDKNKPVWLDFFEVNRNYRHNVAKTQKYIKVGESAIKSFKKEYWHQGIEGRSTFDAQGFYQKYGFQDMDKMCHMRWSPQK